MALGTKRRWVAAAAVPLLALVGLAEAQTSTPASTTLKVGGLEQPVEILRDRWGIAHIYAQTEHDLFFAQGYNAARDRLFQFEIWRRQATGTVAEILGRRELKRDIGTRLHAFRGDLTQELNFYHPRGAAIVTAFVAGVNAYIDEALRRPEALPIEFKLLGITPGKWTTAVVISRHNGLLSNVREEVNTVQAVRVLGADRVEALSNYYGDPKLETDPAIVLDSIAENVLELYDAFRRPIRFMPEDIAAPKRADAATFQRLAASAGGPTAVDLSHRQQDIGSNNWIVSGRLTQSGRPLLANDPHRAQAAPSLRYWTHLVGPGWNVIGGGEPVLPGISIGHNEYGAWGLTIFGTDTEDLYVYDINPGNPLQYRYRDGWETMRVVKETIAVKGETGVTVEFKYTRHGPVLHEDGPGRKAYALRAAWMEQGGAPYLASLRMNQATTWEEFREACSYSRIPAENMIWADVYGNIGYQAVAIAPLRPNWSGLVPVPGDGRYEWDGYLPIQALPHALNPEAGFLVTANNYLFPPNYPYPHAKHWTGADPFRASRITELLASRRPHTVSDMMRLQNDDLSLPARALVPLLKGLPFADRAVAGVRDALLTWDYVLDKDSADAAAYEMFQRRLLANMREAFVPETVRDEIGSIALGTVIEWVEAPDGRFGADPIAGRDTMLARSLEQAVAELTSRFGSDPATWRYGDEKFHHALIRHPLSPAVSAEVRSQLDVGLVPRGGDSYTVTATGGGDNQTSGGSLKFIADVGNWDHSLGLNTPGQSGDPRSPHYRDLFELWSSGKYFPIFYSREKVESVVSERMTLAPTARSSQ
jgi:penicillin amidase